MTGKVLIPIVSLLLVMGVAIGTVVVADDKKGSNNAMVSILCQTASDIQRCQETLGTMNVKDRNDPYAYIVKVVEGGTNSTIKAIKMTDKLLVKYGSDDDLKSLLGACKETLDFAMDSLHFAADVLHKGTIAAVKAQDADMRNWLSAVLSYNASCLDDFTETDDVGQKVMAQLKQSGLDDQEKFAAVGLHILAVLDKVIAQT